MRTVVLLIASNVFMTVAWYGHLKYKSSALWKVILASWFIAFFEYCLQVPANRWGHGRFTTTQLKIIQEVITLAVFTAFAVFYMRESLRWNYLVAYVLIVAAVGFAFWPPPLLTGQSEVPVKRLGSAAVSAEDVEPRENAAALQGHDGQIAKIPVFDRRPLETCSGISN